LTIRQHLRAVALIAPVILPCNVLGWGIGALVVATPLREWSTVFKILMVAGPPIALGIAVKTYSKLRYLANFAKLEDKKKAKDSLGRRLKKEESAVGAPFECPFKSVSCRLFSLHCLVPLTCFIWTAVYVCGLRVGYMYADTLEHDARVGLQVALFSLSIFAMAAGMELLTRWIQKSAGYFGYNHQMLIAFVIIYGMVSDVQVRLGIVKMTGLTRQVCSSIQPLYFSASRFLMSRQWKRSVTSRDVADQDILPDNQEPRLVITCMGLIISQNVSAVILPALTCMFQDISLFSLGTCEEGFWMQIAKDAALTWLLDVISIFNWILQGMPVLYFFSMLDPFLVIAAVLVVYMCTVLALLTACIALP